MKYENTTALITGGSRGLGRALAFELGKRGASLAIAARDREHLAETVESLRRAGITAHGIEGDVGDARSALSIAAQAHTLLGHIDLLVHNASTLGPLPMPPLAELSTEDFARVLEVNLLGPHRLTRAVGGAMILRGGGTIVSMSSDAAVCPYANWGAYSAAKAALDQMSRVWAEESADAGLRFVSIDPGEMDTQMHADALPEADPDSLSKPAEVAERIANFLAADELFKSGARVLAQDIGGAR